MYTRIKVWIFILATMLFYVHPSPAQDLGFISVKPQVPGVGNTGFTGASFNTGFLNTAIAEGKGLQANFLPTFNALDVGRGDINGDGFQDIVTISADTGNSNGQFLTGQFIIFFGLGDGTFSAPLRFPTTRLPRVLAVGDIDADTLADIVIGEQGLVEIYTGFFLTKGIVARQDRIGDPNMGGTGLLVGNDIAAIALGPLNDDMVLDLAILSRNMNSGQVEVFLSNTDGTFNSSADHLINTQGAIGLLGASFGPATHALAIIDGNFADNPDDGGGGDDGPLERIPPPMEKPKGLDIFVATSQGIESFRNNLPGFTAQPVIGMGINFTAILSIDSNRDNRIDLVALNQTSAAVSVFLALEVGYNPPINFSAGPAPVNISFFNFNGDNNTDLVVANARATASSNRGALSVLIGDGRGSFLPFTTLSAPLVNPQTVVAGPFDAASSNDDIVVANATLGQTTGGVLFLSAGQNYNPVPVQLFTTISISTDFDGVGGNNDIILVEQNQGLIFLLLNGVTEVQALVVRDLFTDPGLMPTSVAVFKDAMTGLSNLAITVIKPGATPGNAGQLLLCMNDGNALVRSRQFATSARAGNLISGDVNNDGFDDLIYTDLLSNIVGVAMNDGKNFFVVTQFTEIGNILPTSAVLVDVNDDDFLDIVVANQGVNGQSSLSILKGDGKGRFTLSGTRLQVPSLALSLVGGMADIGPNGTRRIVDFNRDGLPDLAVASTRGAVSGSAIVPSVTIFINRPSSPGMFEARTPVPLTDNTPGNIGGVLQLEASMGGPGIVAGLLGDLSVKVGAGIGGGNRLMSVGDFNADGATDIVVTGTKLVGGLNFRASIFLIGNGAGQPFITRPQRSAEYGGVNPVTAGFDTFISCAAVNFSPLPNRPPDVVHISVNGQIWIDFNRASLLNQAPFITINREDLNAPLGSGRKVFATAGQMISVPVSGFDPDGDSLTFRLVPDTSGEKIPEFVTIVNDGVNAATLQIDTSSLTQVVNPMTVRVGVEVTDASRQGPGGRQPLSDRTFITLVIAPNAAPTIAAIEDQLVLPGTRKTVQLNISDPDNQTVTTSLRCDRGDFITINDNMLAIAPRAVDAGRSICTVTARDQFGLAATATLVVNVPQNNLPVFAAINDITIKAGDMRIVEVMANDKETNDGLVLELLMAPDFVMLVDNGNGQGELTIAPPADAAQGGMVVVQATDSAGESAQLVFNVTVQRAPAIIAAQFINKALFIAGSGFGSDDVKVIVNDKDVSKLIVKKNDTSLTLTGSNKRLNIKKGVNTVAVVVDGVTSNIFELEN